MAVNGQPVRLLGSKVDPAHDQVTVDGKLVRAKKLLYVALNKPTGCVCSRSDELNRPTIYELLPREWGTRCRRSGGGLQQRGIDFSDE